MRFCWGVGVIVEIRNILEMSADICRLFGRVLKTTPLCEVVEVPYFYPSSFANNLFKRLPLRQSKNILVCGHKAEEKAMLYSHVVSILASIRTFAHEWPDA